MSGYPVDAMPPESSIGQVASRSAATRCYEVTFLKQPGFSSRASTLSLHDALPILGSSSATDSARQRSQSRVSSRSSCIACGSMGPGETGCGRKLLASEVITELLPNGGKRRPSRDDGDGEFDRFCARVRKADRDCNI